MKKVTILLVILVTSILGGALAFRLNNRMGSYYCTSTTSSIDVNGLPIICHVRATTGPAAPTLGRCKHFEASTGSDCNIITRWSINQ